MPCRKWPNRWAAWRPSHAPGQGLTIQLELPLTLSVLRTFVAEISGEPFAFPLTRIASVVKVNRADLSTLEGQQYFSLDGERIGVVSALEVLDIAGQAELGRTDFGGLLGDRATGTGWRWTGSSANSKWWCVRSMPGSGKFPRSARPR
jgi:hypothetical protein